MSIINTQITMYDISTSVACRDRKKYREKVFLGTNAVNKYTRF